MEGRFSFVKKKYKFRNPLSNHVLEFQLGTEFLEPQAFSPEPWKVFLQFSRAFGILQIIFVFH
jgi:hypothetical protein